MHLFDSYGSGYRSCIEKLSKILSGYFDTLYSMRTLHHDIEYFLVQYKAIIAFVTCVTALLIAVSYYVVQCSSLHRRMRYRNHAGDAHSDSSSNDEDTKSIETSMLTCISVK